MICVKEYTIGQGKPLVCVPIMEKTKEGIIKEASKLENAKTEMIEWRVDAFEKALDIDAVAEVLAELEQIIDSSLLIYTFRTLKQGGLLEVDDATLEKIHMLGAKSGGVDFVDVEFYAVKEVSDIINKIQKEGKRVIASHHNFSLTPSNEELENLLEGMNKSEADIVKLAVMPQDEDDVLRLLSTTNRMHKKYKDRVFVTMSMGGIGAISRTCGEFFGSAITFGAGEVASAPGQLPVNELQQVLKILHSSLVRN